METIPTTQSQTVSATPTATNSTSWLRKVYSGKISKTNKKKQNTLSKLTSGQIMEVAVASKSACDTFANAKGLVGSVDTGTMTGRTRKQMKIQVRSKKARQLMKKEIFKQKVEVIKAEEKSKKERKARQKTVIVGDMRPIFDALPSVPSLDDEIQNLINQCHSTEARPKTKRKLTMKRRHEEIAQGLNYFAANSSK